MFTLPMFGVIPEDAVNFGIITYTGNASASRAFTGLGFQPDWVWIKRLNTTGNHMSYDAERGVTKQTLFNSASAETTTTSFGSFDSDGFTLGTTTTDTNSSSDTFVAYCWGGGTSESNTDGTLSSENIVVPGKFSIVTYTGNSTGGATVGHGLGSVPKFIMVRDRNGTGNWRVFHTSLGATKNIILDSNAAVSTDSTIWNDTVPDSSVFTLGSGGDVNLSGNPHVAYCFADDSEFCESGTYTGNASATGPIITLSFEPIFVMIRRVDSGDDWVIFDTARDAVNPNDAAIFPNLTNAEQTGVQSIDIDPTGFQIKSTGTRVNASGGSYIYVALKGTV